MALSLPRFSNDPASPYRPRNFIATWDYIATLIEDAFNAGVTAGGGLLGAEYFRSGWLSAIGEQPAILPPNSPNLTVKLREGARLVFDGELIVVEEDTIIGDVPAGALSYLTLEHSLGEDGADIWEPTWHAEDERPALGTGVLAAVLADSDSVLDIDTSAAASDLIWEYPTDAAIRENILQRLADLEAGTGGGGGGPAYIGLGSWMPTPGDTRATSIVIPALIAAAITTLREELLNGGPVRENPEFRAIFDEIGAQSVGLAEVHREAVYRSRSTTIVLDVVNDGSGGSPDDLNEGTAIIDHATGTIGPA